MLPLPIPTYLRPQQPSQAVVPCFLYEAQFGHCAFSLFILLFMFYLLSCYKRPFHVAKNYF